MKIAVIGTGISGNVAAWHLCREHDITVFEAASHVGGHTETHDVFHNGRHYAVDTGFIVFNDWTYPNFIVLLDELGVESQPTEMSFSSRCDISGIEYNGASLNRLFAQRRNLFRPDFHRMIRDILRFNREARALLDNPDATLSLGRYLQENHYSRLFIDNYIIPMGAAIWSTDPQQMLAFPACFFIRFFVNHGLLNINDRPQWRVIKGGSREYVKRLTAPYRDRIRLNEAVVSVRRLPTHVELRTSAGFTQHFDYVFIASHSDQALTMLSDATQAERDVLGAIPYQHNDAVLHTDTSALPRTKRAWAAWNYLRRADGDDRASVTYNMNILQNLQAPVTFCVSLNDTRNIEPGAIISRVSYQHPVYTSAGVAAQARQREINGKRRTWYCGAYWRYGFHEDGVVSSLNALRDFTELVGNAQLSLRWAS